jgi:hypothetical protein
MSSARPLNFVRTVWAVLQGLEFFALVAELWRRRQLSAGFRAMRPTRVGVSRGTVVAATAAATSASSPSWPPVAVP